MYKLKNINCFIHIEKLVNASNNECFKSLSWGPYKHVTSCHGYFVNEFRFHTQERGLGSLPYNYGVRVKESVDIRRRSSIVDEDENNEDEEEAEWESNEEEEEFELESDSKIWYMGLRKGLTQQRTSLSPAAASIPPGMSTPPIVASISSVTLTPFPQLPYSSQAPMSTPSASPSHVHPTPAPLFKGVVHSHILILLTTDGTGIYGTRFMSVLFGTFGTDWPYYNTRT
ncbi:hypothetical protein M9H77_18860 [Catharanthus roseus]|uniref:Uncharacterized protein n=1 Tax=Catharanthus roseus TaxID=4058 RepID=A0ACC0B8T0_CATRO|nr:hypothetical protein M9H77_18860 [Catharanthus roseus]